MTIDRSWKTLWFKPKPIGMWALKTVKIVVVMKICLSGNVIQFYWFNLSFAAQIPNVYSFYPQ
jgi:hypothetical protein